MVSHMESINGSLLSLEGTTNDVGPSTALPVASTAGGKWNRGGDGKEKEMFPCLFAGCEQKYSRMEYLKRHQRKHQDDRPFHCKSCTKAFARSDVLLRHRRRCHPTPPPIGHSISPPSSNRTPNRMPVSSSRMGEREGSPKARRDRKHPRQSDHEEDEESQRARINQSPGTMADGGHENEAGPFSNRGHYGGIHGQYNRAAKEEHPNYSGDFMPTFGQGRSNHGGPGLLEDAAALLSMVYSGGVPSGEGQRQDQREMSDWTSNPTVNLIMETAVPSQKRTENARATLADPSQKELTQSSAGSVPVSKTTGVASILEGTSITSQSTQSPHEDELLFTSFLPDNSFDTPTPLTEGTNRLANDKSSGNTGPESGLQQGYSPDVRRLFEQFAQYHTPETMAGPNPERALLRVDNANVYKRQGEEISKDSPFYLPADMFAGVYSIPHWALPPVRALSVIACRTFHTVLNHFSFVHLPTFRLIDTASYLRFAICTVSGMRTGKPADRDTLTWKDPIGDALPSRRRVLDGPVMPNQSWEHVYEQNWHNYGTGIWNKETKNVANWRNGSILRTEKTDKLVECFSLAKEVRMSDGNVSLLQALILFHAPFLLSEEETERARAHMFVGTIVDIARRIGLFNDKADHARTALDVLSAPFVANDLQRPWREWISMESRRRTAYLVYQLDTLSSLECDIPTTLSSCEIAKIPLPAPDTLWKAYNAEDWYKAMKSYRPMTLDEAMRRTFFPPTYGTFDSLHENADTRFYNILNQSDYGPFARMSMIIALLRGVIDIGRGKRAESDWINSTVAWVDCSWLKQGKKTFDQDGTELEAITIESLEGRFKTGLQKWREGWDFDSLCLIAGAKATTPGAECSAYSESSDGSYNIMPREAHNYCEDALPLYWLAQGLLNIVFDKPDPQPGQNASTGLRYCEMLKAARTFTRMGEGVGGKTGNMSTPPYRDMGRPSSSSGVDLALAQSMLPTPDAGFSNGDTILSSEPAPNLPAIHGLSPSSRLNSIDGTVPDIIEPFVGNPWASGLAFGLDLADFGTITATGRGSSAAPASGENGRVTEELVNGGWGDTDLTWRSLLG